MMTSDFTHNLDLFPLTIAGNHEIAPGVYVLSYPRNHIFIPGQVVAITADLKGQPRLYSIASGKQDEMIRLLYNVKPGGELSPALSELKAGDTLLVSAPFGTFFGTDKPAVLIASGTGIAPFASMLRSGLHMDKTLIHGGKTLDSFYFRDEFEALLGGGNYIRCCSQEKGDGVFEGRLTKYIREHQHFPADYKYYLCGLAEMVVETRDLLIGKGIPYENIIAEIYF